LLLKCSALTTAAGEKLRRVKEPTIDELYCAIGHQIKGGA